MVLLTILLKYDLRMSSTIAGYIIFYTQNGTRINRRVCILSFCHKMDII